MTSSDYLTLRDPGTLSVEKKQTVTNLGVEAYLSSSTAAVITYEGTPITFLQRLSWHLGIEIVSFLCLSILALFFFLPVSLW